MHHFVEKVILFSALIVAFLGLLKFVLPVIKSILTERKNEFAKMRFTLQSQLRDSRVAYQDANFLYLKSVEKKIRWMDEARDLAEKKIEELEEKHERDMKNLHAQYEQKRKALKVEISRMHLNELISVFSESISQNADNVDVIEIVRKIGK